MEFKSGDEVEVCSSDDGFQGAWYGAKIVRSMTKQSRYTVVYEPIVLESKPSKNVRETVNASCVRPRPISGRGGKFTIQQHVDAFYKGGWWEGIVSDSLGSKPRVTYSVKFVITGDVIEFEPSDLRVHSDWVPGKWVTSLMQVASHTEANSTKDIFVGIFERGTSVEVTSDDEGFRGAWFPAKLVDFIGNKFLVEYRDLMTDDETEPLKETVDALHIRPSPPAFPILEKFKYLQEVDAYYNDGWWVGVISKVLESSRYMVFFKPWKQEMEFQGEDLRPHHDWIDGRWFQASQDLGLEY